MAHFAAPMCGPGSGFGGPIVVNSSNSTSILGNNTLFGDTVIFQDDRLRELGEAYKQAWLPRINRVADVLRIDCDTDRSARRVTAKTVSDYAVWLFARFGEHASKLPTWSNVGCSPRATDLTELDYPLAETDAERAAKGKACPNAELLRVQLENPLLNVTPAVVEYAVQQLTDEAFHRKCLGMANAKNRELADTRINVYCEWLQITGRTETEFMATVVEPEPADDSTGSLWTAFTSMFSRGAERAQSVAAAAEAVAPVVVAEVAGEVERVAQTVEAVAEEIEADAKA